MNKTTSLLHQHLRQADDLQLQGGEEEEGGLLWHKALELGVAVGLREAGEQGGGKEIRPALFLRSLCSLRCLSLLCALPHYTHAPPPLPAIGPPSPAPTGVRAEHGPSISGASCSRQVAALPAGSQHKIIFASY